MIAQDHQSPHSISSLSFANLHNHNIYLPSAMDGIDGATFYWLCLLMDMSYYPTLDIATNLTSDPHSLPPQGPPAVDDSGVDHLPGPPNLPPHTHNLRPNTEARSLRSCRTRPLCHLTQTFRPILKTTSLIPIMRAHLLPSGIPKTRCSVQGPLCPPRYASSHLPRVPT